MRGLLVGTCLSTAAMFAAGSAYANEELIKLSQDPKQWVMQAGDYANTRYSKLDQINARTMSASSRWPGPSRPACCAATRARRSWSAT